MPRPLRVHMEGALTYVTCRAEPGIPLFQDARDTEAYLELLSQYKSQYGFRVYAFSLCAYDLHLLLETGVEATISQFMHALNSRYTKLYCRRYIHTGHLFQGRFRAVVAEREPYLLPLIRFVHGQPEPLISSLLRYEGKDSLATGWLDTLETGAESWKMEDSGPEMGELKGLLQKPAVGSAAFLEEVKRQTAAAVPAAPKAGPEEEDLKELEEEEEELVPIPVRIRTGWHRSGFVAVAAMAALAGLLSQRPAPVGESQVRVIVESRQAPASSAPAAVAGSQLASMVPSPSLGGTTWNLQIRSMRDSNNALIREDLLRFDRSRVASSHLSDEGFAPSNYTITPQEDGTFVWETMQAGPGGEVVCWRGECDGRRMRGVMTRQKDGKETESFNFIAVNPMSEA